MISQFGDFIEEGLSLTGIDPYIKSAMSFFGARVSDKAQDIGCHAD